MTLFTNAYTQDKLMWRWWHYDGIMLLFICVSFRHFLTAAIMLLVASSTLLSSLPLIVNMFAAYLTYCRDNNVALIVDNSFILCTNKNVMD